jgi:poly(3-hydroxybutyrate) depolymerase
MKQFIRLFQICCALGLASGFSVENSNAADASGRPAIENLSARKFTATMQADYLLFLPKGYDAKNARRWPLILFLHGAGERGTNVWTTAVHGPARYIEKHPEFPFIVVSPVCPNGAKWSDDLLLGLLDSITANYAVDTNRIYLTGLSMGGFGAWSLATTYPERFAAVAPRWVVLDGWHEGGSLEETAGLGVSWREGHRGAVGGIGSDDQIAQTIRQRGRQPHRLSRSRAQFMDGHV